MPNLWFSYSDGGQGIDGPEPLNSPYSITHHIGRMLRDKAHEHGYAYRYVNLDDETPVTFEPLDICVGHLWHAPNSFMRQALASRVKAKIILQPYSHNMVSDGDIAAYVALFHTADELLFISGEYWHLTMLDSPFASIHHKVTRLDMAVSGTLHPYLKTRWNKQGERSLCVIGHDIPVKGFKNVADLARTAGIRLGHFGSAKAGTFDDVPQMTLHGGMLFTPDVIAAVCDQYDAIACLATSDANPTVLLEAAAWGLSVYANLESGYLPYRPFQELRLNDPRFNLNQMRQFQQMDEYELRRDSEALREVVERDYTWQKMSDTVWQTVSKYL